MDLPLPRFKYHPDPIATGAIEASAKVCECCGVNRGFIYTSNVYCTKDIEAVCPWCIANGSVARIYNATLSDSDGALRRAGIAEDVIREVAERTPGYVCWQSNDWMTCCNDACEFHGDAPKEEIQRLDERGLTELSRASGFDVEDLHHMTADYEPGASPAFYKFVCRHCSRVLYNGDCD